MPNIITFPDGERKSVATVSELLEFCNKGRAAGAADLLDALLPSQPGNSEACLIANAMNFGCWVDRMAFVERERRGIEGSPWFMIIARMPQERAQVIADALGCSLHDTDDGLAIMLPEHIGNAAEAFDLGIAFIDYKASE